MTVPISDELRSKALQALGKKEGAKNLRLGAIQADRIPSNKRHVYRFDAFNADDPNGPRFSVVLDETGEAHDPEALRKREGKTFFAAATFEPGMPHPMAGPAASITIDPTENDLVLNPGDSFEEEIIVKVPGNVGVSKADVYFLADTTGSMSGILAAVQAGANNILAALAGLGIDLAFGVGNYKDLPATNPPFQHQLAPTTVPADVTNAINAWAASGGDDRPEGQFFALNALAEAPGGAIGWRAGSKRIIVWFGDAPGHDPVCAAISGLPFDITEASATAKLVGQSITVLAISTNTGAPDALDGDPTAGAGDYTGACGPAGGTPGQATRIAAATGGQHVSGIDAGTIVNTIIDLVSTAAQEIRSLKLVPTGDIVPFVVSIAPPEYGPLAGDEDHTLVFKVVFRGVEPCRDKDGVFTGTLDAVADGVVVARKRVRITVPACEPKNIYSYSVKFVCGVQEECGCDCVPGVRPGAYSTQITIHNFSPENASIRKYVFPVVFAGAPQGREPRYVSARARDGIILPADTVTMDDCCRLSELLFDGAPPSRLPVTIGILEIVSSIELMITAVYTASDPKSGSLSIDVEQVRGQLKPLRRPLLAPAKPGAGK